MSEPTAVCPQCSGTGRTGFMPKCPGCKGSGRIPAVQLAPPPPTRTLEADFDRTISALNGAISQVTTEKAALQNALQDMIRERDAAREDTARQILLAAELRKDIARLTQALAEEQF